MSNQVDGEKLLWKPNQHPLHLSETPLFSKDTCAVRSISDHLLTYHTSIALSSDLKLTAHIYIYIRTLAVAYHAA